MLEQWLAGALVLATTVAAILWRWRMVYAGWKIPGELALPLIGHAYLLRNCRNSAELKAAFVEIVKRCEVRDGQGLMKFWMGPWFLVFVWEPELIEVIANSQSSAQKGALYSWFFGDFIDGAFVASGGQRWRELRRPVVRSITKSRLDGQYIDAFNRRSSSFVDFIRKKRLGKECNIIHDISRLLLDTFSETHLGVSLNEVEENKWEYHENFDGLIEILSKTVLFVIVSVKHLMRFSKHYPEFVGRTKNIHSFYQWVLDSRKSSQLTDGNRSKEYYPNFLLRRGQEKNIPEEQLRMELADLILGGTDTSAVILSSALLFLAMFPEVQRKVQDEQEKIFSGSTRQPTPSDLNQMDYLTMVVKESLRICGPHTVSKSVEEDIHIGNYLIPKGTYIGVFLYKLHRDKRYYERADEFYPEHFSAEGESRRPRYTFLPFGCGPRTCPGFQYAINFMKIVLSAITRRFNMTTSMKFDEITFQFKLLNEITQGYYIKFEERSNV